MPQSKTWQFEITDGKLTYDGIFAGEAGQPIALEDQRVIARELVETWWESRTLAYGDAVFPLRGEAAAENERTINRGLALKRAIKLVDTKDQTIIIQAQYLVPLANALETDREQSMGDWDAKSKIIETGSAKQVVAVIQELLPAA